MLSRLPPQLLITPHYAKNEPERRATSYEPRAKHTQFQLLEQIGKGHFSKVIKVSNAGTIYALKVMEKRFIQSRNLQAQVAREIEIQSLLKHPNIVRLHGNFQDHQSYFLITEYCPYGSIFNKEFDEQTIKTILRQVLSAVQHLHLLGIIHRDIKPENIYIVAENMFKLGDFGCANYKRQRRRTFCGTPEYMSPEVYMCSGRNLDNTAGYDQRTDIWSIGILLYELITGRTPFRDLDQASQMKRICREPIRFPSSMDRLAVDFIRICLSRDPNQRPSVEDLLNHQYLN